MTLLAAGRSVPNFTTPSLRVMYVAYVKNSPDPAPVDKENSQCLVKFITPEEWGRGSTLDIMGIAVITVGPAGKASLGCTQTRPMSHSIGKWHISLACVSKPLVTVIRAMASHQFVRSSYLYPMNFGKLRPPKASNLIIHLMKRQQHTNEKQRD